MREIVYSAATLAGFIGLACLYQNGQIGDRVKRDTSFSAIQETADLFNSTEPMDNPDFDFLQSMGWLDAGADIPDEFIEDVKFYQEDCLESEKVDGVCPPDTRSGGARKQIQFVVKCLKSDTCRPRAEKTVASWGKNMKKYIEGNIGVLLRPVSTEERMDENSPIGICTPNNPAQDCSATSGSDSENPEGATTFVAAAQPDPSAALSTHQSALDALAKHAEDADSDEYSNNLNNVNSNLNAGLNSADNVFGSGSGGVKIILVVPNGIPVHMKDNYQSQYGNYWRWFKNFNERYMGITAQANFSADKARNNFHFWFIRQDKMAKFVMKNAAKANRRFPWNRFDNLMLKVQSTAVQPKLKATYESIAKEINNKGFASTSYEGMDCVMFWFHHYLPQDLLEIADSKVQEDAIAPLDAACNTIHFWVGFGQDLGEGSEFTMAESRTVINYMQGLLQPSQITHTSADTNMRNYHHVSDLASLVGDDGAALAGRVYNDIALDRKRVKCLFNDGGKDIAAQVEVYNNVLAAKQQDYQAYFYEDGMATSEVAWANYETAEAAYAYEITDPQQIDYGYEAYAYAAPEGPKDFACCGRGFGGKKYDMNTHECCEEGSVKDINEGCISYI